MVWQLEKTYSPFTTPSPDFDMRSPITQLPTVTMIVRVETSGFATDNKRQFDTTFRFMNLFGNSLLKPSYVGKIIPRDEYGRTDGS